MEIFYCYSVIDIDTGVRSSSIWHPTPLVCPAVGSQFEFLNGPTIVSGYVDSVATVVSVVRDASGSTRIRQDITHVVRVSQAVPLPVPVTQGADEDPFRTAFPGRGITDVWSERFTAARPLGRNAILQARSVTRWSADPADPHFALATGGPSSPDAQYTGHAWAAVDIAQGQAFLIDIESRGYPAPVDMYFAFGLDAGGMLGSGIVQSYAPGRWRAVSGRAERPEQIGRGWALFSLFTSDVPIHAFTVRSVVIAD